MSVRMRFVVFFSCVFLLSNMALAQAQTNRMVKRSVAAVLFASLGGAVLGLSTLPFYGEPREHTNNISTGALLGLVGGLSYVVYDNTRPSGSYEFSDFHDESQKFTRGALKSVPAAAPLFNLSYNF